MIEAIFTIGGIAVAIIIVTAMLARQKSRPPKSPSFRQIKRSIRREGRLAAKQLQELERDVHE